MQAPFTRVTCAAALTAVAMLAACGSSSDSTPPKQVSKILNFSATLTPAGEIGATLAGNPTGSGTFTATLDTSTNVLTWSGTFSGMTSTVNNAHIHGPFSAGGTSNSAGVILDFNPANTPGATFTGLNTGTSGSLSGTVTLTSTFPGGAVNGDSLKKLLIAGATYVNVHTTTNKGGEIRGQVVRVP